MPIDIFISVLAHHLNPNLVNPPRDLNFVKAKINWAKAEIVTVSLKSSQNLPTTRLSNSMPCHDVEFTTYSHPNKT